MDKTIIFDIETDSIFAPYAKLHMIGYQVGLYGKPQILDFGNEREVQGFKRCIEDPEWTKIHFNGINYDEIVMRLHGYYVNPVNRHDVYLMAKTVAPSVPSYGLKFLNWWYFGDPHDPERRLWAWCKHHFKDMHEAPHDLMSDYCCHDVLQTARLYKMLLPLVHSPRHWRAYSELELRMGEVVQQMVLEGGECLNLKQIRTEMNKLRMKIDYYNRQAKILTRGKVTNLASTQQVSKQLYDVDGWELSLSDKGNLVLRKDDLLTMLDLDDPANDQSRLARLTYECRDKIKQLGYLNSYRRALLYELRSLDRRRVYRTRGYGKIPKSYHLSGARTRRILSSSKFGINFQNQNHSSKTVQLVPKGWLGVWIDSTQIENVVHMWASHDYERIRSYTADVDWSEYVWLCNRILGGHRTREELDNITSQANPAWSVYKQFKTAKLALNFGMGVGKFSRVNRIDGGRAKELFADIHKACPAIKHLQRLIAQQLASKGFISDPFGHIYTGDPESAYKVVAYFVQGCGTGSVPKAMARAIYDVLQPLGAANAVMTTMIHDEIGFRLRLRLTTGLILDTLRKCLHCMEGQFSPMFDGIPLRAKLSLSITNAADAKVINHYHMTPEEWDNKIYTDYIAPGRL